jgi:hypothetical protein
MILILRGFYSFWKFNNQLMPNWSASNFIPLSTSRNRHGTDGSPRAYSWVALNGSSQTPYPFGNIIADKASARGALAWFRVRAAPSFASEQRIKTPSAAALRRYVQEDETEQDCRHALVLHGPSAIRCVKLPIRNRHHAGQNESDCTGEQTEHDRNATKKF